jgi:COMPASS component SPP1
MCRLEGCREAAAIRGPKPSKYCCDDHAAKFFRQYLKKGFGTEAITPAKKRRKDNLTDNYSNAGDEFDKPAHLRGGLLSPAELKSITKGLQSNKEFRSLGENVPIVDEKDLAGDAMQTDSANPQLPDHESDQLGKTTQRAEKLRHRLRSLEDRDKFLTLVKNRAKSVSEELKKKDKTLKDICGFDRRLRWSDEEFDAWRGSEEGEAAFKTNKLGPPNDQDQVDADGDANMTDGVEEFGKGICQKRRCKQHEGWYKLHSQEFTYNRSDLQRSILRLAGEERSIRERAMIRHLESQAGPDGCDGYF